MAQLLWVFQLTKQRYFMPIRNTTSKTTNTGKGTSTGSKTTGNRASATNKKQGAVNVKVPTAREKAKDFDEGRRMDANSNELN